MKKINFSKQPIIIKVCKSSTNHIGSNDLLYVACVTDINWKQNTHDKNIHNAECLGTYNLINKCYSDFSLTELANFCSFSDLHTFFEHYNENFFGLVNDFTKSVF